MLYFLLPCILPESGGLSSENSSTLLGRGPGGLLYLGMLETALLGMLDGLMLSLFSMDFCFEYSSLWWSFSGFTGPGLGQCVVSICTFPCKVHVRYLG